MRPKTVIAALAVLLLLPVACQSSTHADDQPAQRGFASIANGHVDLVPGHPNGAQWIIDLTACATQDPCPEVFFIGPGGGTMDIQSGPSLTTMRADIRPGDLVGINAPIGLKWHNNWWIVTGLTREQIPPASTQPWLDTPSPPLRLYEVWADGTLVKTKVYLERIYCETCHF